KDGEALRALSKHMGAALSTDEMHRLWTNLGEPVFNKAYFDRRVDSFLAEHKGPEDFAFEASRWLDGNFREMPRPAAEYLLASLRAKVDPATVQYGSAPLFYASLSGLVEQAPAQAAATAQWYTSVRGAPERIRMPMRGFDFNYAITHDRG